MGKWISTVTNKGYALQAKLLSTDKLNITRVVSGSGSCAVTQLINQTAVSDIKQELIVDSLSYDKNNNARLKVTLSNIDLNTGYDVNQIGIYATDPDEGEILYGIAQADEAEPIPSISEQPNGFYCSWDFSLTYSNAQNVNVTIDPSNAISREAADLRYVQLAKIGDNLSVDENGVLSADAQEITVDDKLSSSSTNPVQNKVVNTALGNKVDKVNGKGLSTNDYTTDEKNKLSGIEAGANNYVHPSSGIGTISKDKLYAISTESKGHLSEYIELNLVGLSYDGKGSLKNSLGKNGTGKNAVILNSDKNKANGECSLAEGNETRASAPSAHSEGNGTTSVGTASHCEGYSMSQAPNEYDSGTSNDTILSDWGTNYFSLAKGYASHCEGRDCLALGDNSHAEGGYTIASGEYSHSEGMFSFALGTASHAEGRGSYPLSSLGFNSSSTDEEIFEKWALTGSDAQNFHMAKGMYAHVEGFNNLALGSYSHAGGQKCASKGYGSFSHGMYLEANGFQTVVGKCNAVHEGLESYESVYTSDGTTFATIFTIGCGTGASTTARKNALRVTTDGQARGLKAFLSSGADFAEYMEWEDGNPDNEDRRGRMVAYALTDAECVVEEIEILDPVTHEKKTIEAVVRDKMPPIRYATSFDECIGVVSSSGAFIGNSASEEWNSQYVRDIFGEKIVQAVLIPEETKTYNTTEIDEETGEEVIVEKTEVIPEHWVNQYVLNPHYDPEAEYIEREHRKEWSPVGFHGQIVAVDDGTCVVGGYCSPAENGIATASETGFRVIQRLDKKHVRLYVE